MSIATPQLDQTAISTRKATVFRESAAVLITQVLALVFAVLVNFLLARLLGPDGRGVLYFMQMVSALGLTLLNFGLGPAAVYYAREGRYPTSQIATGLLVPSFLLGIAPLTLFLASYKLWPAQMFAKVPLSAILLSLVAIPVLIITWNVAHLCLGMQRNVSFNLFRVAPNAILLALLVVVVAMGKIGVWPISLVWLASLVIPAVAAIIVTITAGAGWPSVKDDFIKNGFKYAWHTHVSAVTQYLQYRADIFLVSVLLPIHDLGIYSLAVVLGELVWNVPTAIAIVLMPHISELTDQHANEVTPLFCRSALLGTALLGLVLLLICSLVIPLYLPQFKGAIPALWMLMPGIVIATIFKILSSDISGRGKPLASFLPALGGLVIVTISGLVLIPRFGIMGAATVSTMGYVLNAVMYVRYFQRVTGVSAIDLVIPKWSDVKVVALMLEPVRGKSLN